MVRLSYLKYERVVNMQKKKEQLIQFHKNNILEAAKQLFLEKGFIETTMDDIAKLADYSKSTVYVYFKSKEDIYNHIIFSYMQLLHVTIEKCIKESDKFEQCYFNICEALVTAYEDYPLFFESTLGHISTDEQELSANQILRQIYDEGEQINNSMIKLFEMGIQQQYLRDSILILPTVFTLWASITNTIIIANQKEKYIAQRMQMSKSKFLEYSFQLLLVSLKDR